MAEVRTINLTGEAAKAITGHIPKKRATRKKQDGGNMVRGVSENGMDVKGIDNAGVANAGNKPAASLRTSRLKPVAGRARPKAKLTLS